MPNALLQFYFIKARPGVNGEKNEKYVLMLRDDYSEYKWFFANDPADADNGSRPIIDWTSAFGVPNALRSDGSTHFKYETLILVSKGLKVPHHFTLPYYPWSNCAVERVGKEPLRTIRAVTSELKIQPEEWGNLHPLV